jgi:transposase
MPPAEQLPTRGLTVAGYVVRDLARRWRVSEDKVRLWIKRGELKATNTAMALCGRPRWVVSADAVAEFERRRASGPPPKVSRRPRHAAAIDYFPD